MSTLSEQIRNCRTVLLGVRHVESDHNLAFALECITAAMELWETELEGKVVVTPVTVELDPGVWVTRPPHIEVHGASPEESMASFVERVEEVECG